MVKRKEDLIDDAAAYYNKRKKRPSKKEGKPSDLWELASSAFEAASEVAEMFDKRSLATFLNKVSTTVVPTSARANTPTSVESTSNLPNLANSLKYSTGANRDKHVAAFVNSLKDDDNDDKN